MQDGAVSFGDNRFHLDSTVESVAVSPDGTHLAAAGTSKTVVWELATARVVATTGQSAFAVAFSDDQTLWLAMARLHKWRFHAAPEPTEISKNESPMVVSRDGALVAAAARGDVAILSTADGRVRRVCKGRRQVRSLAFSPDGARLAVASEQRAVIFDVADGREVEVVVPERGSTVHVGFLSQERLLVARDVSKAVSVVPLDGAPASTLALVDYFSDFAVAPDGSRFVVVSDSGIQIFDAASLVEIQRVLQRQPWQAPAFVGAGRVAVGALRAVHFFDVEAGHIEQPPPAQQDGASAIACSPDGAFVATAGGANPAIRLWHPGDGGLVATLHCQHRIDALAVSPDGKTVAAGTWRTLALFDVASGAARTFASALREVAAVAYAPDGRLATASERGRLVLRDVASGAETQVVRELPRFPGETGRPGLAFSGDGRWLALAPAAGGLLVFDAATGAAVLSRRGKAPRAAAVAFSGDATRVGYADGDAAVVLDLPAGTVVRRREAGAVVGLALVPGELLVIAPRGAATLVVDVETGQSRTLETERVACALTSAPDGRILVGYEDGTAALVPLELATPDDGSSPYRVAGARPVVTAMKRPAPASDDEVRRAARGLFVVRRSGPRLSLDVHWPRYRIRQHLFFGVVYALPAALLFSPSALGLVLGVPMACASLYRFYLALACGVNHSRLDLDDAELRVALGPLPWWGNRRLPVRRVDQLYVKELAITYSSRNGHHTEYYYDLRAQLADGSDVKVLSAALEPDQAKALEAALEAHLGIQNRPVDGEYTG